MDKTTRKYVEKLLHEHEHAKRLLNEIKDEKYMVMQTSNFEEVYVKEKQISRPVENAVIFLHSNIEILQEERKRKIIDNCIKYASEYSEEIYEWRYVKNCSWIQVQLEINISERTCKRHNILLLEKIIFELGL